MKKYILVLAATLLTSYVKAQNVAYLFGMNINGQAVINSIPIPVVANTGSYTDLLNIPNISRVLFTNSGTTTLSGTTTETSLVPAGVGSMTVPSTPIAGREYRIQIGGIYSVPLVTGGQLTIKVKYNGTTLATSTITNAIAGATNLSFDGNFKIVNLTIGASGTAVISGTLNYSNGNNVARIGLDINNGGTSLTLNNSVAGLLEITGTWDTNNAGKSIKVNQISVEQLN